ncbi:FAE1/Type III polyketide synthase-like protein-domain-containing protein [Dunaliella salina]|uniref:3-ketoacyl-CoA synthase n=1 Tax=Dunaliella salina TaxID=3046 RepID=A0ABQ7H4W3_DUNSA|nr:FAE1/Type III polyketide synthase-like protein-domain-containing protein [Dunaliella salina]|eukprot:KAF5841900.1 FAE1/Type III polyketide synthase-like protein-domain-containing protein [Dunaliella salina]
MLSSRKPVLLIDLENYVPPEEYKVSMENVARMWRETKMYSGEEIEWMMGKIQSKSGLSTYSAHLPPAIHPQICRDKPKTDLASAYDECKMAVVGAVEGLLARTGLQPSDVDILVTTCSIYCPTPSMASMVVNHFKMKKEIQSYHLEGMGCANGVVAINMISDLLQAHPNANAVFVTTETTTPAFYAGHDKHRMVTNILFRMGAAAVLLSNKSKFWDGRAKYQLVCIVPHGDFDAKSWYTPFVSAAVVSSATYLQLAACLTSRKLRFLILMEAIQYGPDQDGINGIYLGKNVVSEASRALTKALYKIAPSVLHPVQKLRFAATYAVRKLLGPDAASPYTPNFSGPVQHFALHAGGARVLDGIAKAMQLEEYDMAPSRAVLHDYGNVSSSTTWYTLGFIETVRGVQKGDTILQVGVGSGIKCGVNYWQALRDVDDLHEAWQHRASPERLAQLNAPAVDGRHAMVHMAMRVIFMLVMGVIMYLFMLLQDASFVQPQQISEL